MTVGTATLGRLLLVELIVILEFVDVLGGCFVVGFDGGFCGLRSDDDLLDLAEALASPDYWASSTVPRDLVADLRRAVGIRPSRKPPS